MNTSEVSNPIKKVNGYEIQLSENRNGKPVARIYRELKSGANKGQLKYVNGFYFSSESSRQDYIDKFVKDQEKSLAAKIELDEKKKSIRSKMEHPFSVGQIYYDSWGYEQTNVDFYQVIEVKEKSIVICEIAGEMVSDETRAITSDSGRIKPIKDKFVGAAESKKILFYIDSKGETKFYIKSAHGWISLYEKADDGVYCSWGY